MESEENEERGNIILSNAVLIASAPAFAYGVTFAFETGFAGYYGIPISLIIVTLENFFAFLGAILWLVLSLFFILNMLATFIPEKYRENSNLLYPAGFIFLYWLFILFISKDIETALSYSIGPTIIIGFPAYILPLIVHRRTKGYLNKLRESEEIDIPVRRRTIIGKLQSKFGYTVVLTVVLAIFVIPYIANQIGYYRAKSQKNYSVWIDDKPCVVLRIYSDRVICFPLKNDEVDISTIVIRTLSSTNEMTLRTRIIGPIEMSLERRKSESWS